MNVPPIRIATKFLIARENHAQKKILNGGAIMLKKSIFMTGHPVLGVEKKTSKKFRNKKTIQKNS